MLIRCEGASWWPLTLFTVEIVQRDENLSQMWARRSAHRDDLRSPNIVADVLHCEPMSWLWSEYIIQLAIENNERQIHISLSRSRPFRTNREPTEGKSTNQVIKLVFFSHFPYLLGSARQNWMPRKIRSLNDEFGGSLHGPRDPKRLEIWKLRIKFYLY